MIYIQWLSSYGDTMNISADVTILQEKYILYLVIYLESNVPSYSEYS